MSFKGAMERLLPRIEAELRDVARSPHHTLATYYGMTHYHLGWVDEALQPVQVSAGKRLRPILSLLSCEAMGGDSSQALPAAEIEPEMSPDCRSSVAQLSPDCRLFPPEVPIPSAVDDHTTNSSLKTKNQDSEPNSDLGAGPDRFTLSKPKERKLILPEPADPAIERRIWQHVCRIHSLTRDWIGSSLTYLAGKYTVTDTEALALVAECRAAAEADRGGSARSGEVDARRGRPAPVAPAPLDARAGSPRQDGVPASVDAPDFDIGSIACVGITYAVFHGDLSRHLQRF